MKQRNISRVSIATTGDDVLRDEEASLRCGSAVVVGVVPVDRSDRP
jgi:hypothetical protein